MARPWLEWKSIRKHSTNTTTTTTTATNEDNTICGTTRDHNAHLLEVFGEVGDGAPLACVKEHPQKLYYYYYYCCCCCYE